MNTHIFQLFLAIAATAFVVASCGISDRNDHGDADSQQAPDVSAPSICASGPVVIDAAGKVIGKVVDLSHFSFKVRGCDSKWLATLSYNIGPDSVEVLAAAATCTELGLRVATGESIEMNEFFGLLLRSSFGPQRTASLKPWSFHHYGNTFPVYLTAMPATQQNHTKFRSCGSNPVTLSCRRMSCR